MYTCMCAYMCGVYLCMYMYMCVCVCVCDRFEHVRVPQIFHAKRCLLSNDKGLCVPICEHETMCVHYTAWGVHKKGLHLDINTKQASLLPLP